ncbi:MAG: hypothetical protein IJ234_04475 [Clostridia bacterium]|nr:hypothetical protein [Clostridia bacterium]
MSVLLQLILLFYLYSFLGWCCEVAFAASQEKRFVNRGFLNGPVCPIYGFGVLGVLLLLRPLSGGGIVSLFLGSVVVTTLIEWLTGFLLEKIFHARWWDYSEYKWNIGGYICPLFSAIWGVACVVVVKCIAPIAAGGVALLPYWAKASVAALCSAVFMLDLCATIATIRKLSERMRRLTAMANEIHSLSDDIGERISDTTMAVMSKAAQGEQRIIQAQQATEERIERGRQSVMNRIEQGRESVAGHIDSGRRAVLGRLTQATDANRQRVAELRGKISELLGEHPFGENRLLRAFPQLTSQKYPDAFRAIREAYETRSRRKRED